MPDKRLDNEISFVSGVKRVIMNDSSNLLLKDFSCRNSIFRSRLLSILMHQ